jgi:uncharacterized protein YjaZ
MAQINLLVANASQAFSENDTAVFEAAKRDAEAFIASSFDFDYSVDIVMTTPSLLTRTIPEDGIGARTFSSNLIVVVIDKSQKQIEKEIVFETMCHELSHSMRWEKVPEYANTLFEGMILEGLAVALEQKALADTNARSKQFFLSEVLSTPQDVIDGMILELKDHFENDKYDYDTIFFSGTDTLPRWAGYRLGYYYVSKYLEESGADIAEATLASYKSFLA